MIPVFGKPRGVVFAHEMGLGKTAATVATIAELRRRGKDIYPLVLTAPLSMLAHWKETFELYAGFTDKAEIIHLGNKDRVPMYQAQVWIMTFEGLTQQFKEIALKRAKMIVVDEASKLKNPKARFVKVMKKLAKTCDYRLLLTATPLENNVMELHTLMNIVHPGFGGSERRFKMQFKKSLEDGVKPDASPTQQLFARKAAVELNNMLRPFLLRKLNPTPKQCDIVVQTPMTPEQETCYNLVKDSHEMIFKKQRKVKWQGSSYTESYLDPISRKRQQKQMAELWSVVVGTHPLMNSVETGKLSWFRNHLPNMLGQSGKIAIFFKYLETLKNTRILLENMGIECVTINGAVSAQDRNLAILAMNTGTARVLLGTSRSCGYGINLLSINKIILAEVDWNGSIDLQTAARGSRPGNPNAVTVYRMATPHSIEQHADTVASNKLTLSRLVLDDRLPKRDSSHAIALKKAHKLTMQSCEMESFDLRQQKRAVHFQC